MFRKFLIGLVAVISTVIAGGNAVTADEFHYNNLLIGDRASGMGGAYTAISDDPSGLYYNPAGIVYSTGRNLSASVNAYYSHSKKYDGVIAGHGWERTSSSLLPNFFGVTQPLGKFQFGFSYAVPDSIREDQDQTFGNVPTTLGPSATYVINFNNDDNTYLFGPSLAYEVNPKLSVGMTLYLHNRSAQTTLNQELFLSDGTTEWKNIYIEKVERGMRPILGVMWTPVDKITIGVSLARTFLYGASQNSQYTSKDSTSTPPNDVQRATAGTGYKRQYPYELRMGAAYFASSSLLLSVDGVYYTKVTDANFGNRVSVFNAAAGTEYYLNRNWALRGGVFSNMANTPEINPSRSGQDERVDMYGASMSVSNFTRKWQSACSRLCTVRP